MYVSCLEEINSISEDLDQLVMTSELVYDAKFHRTIIRRVNKVSKNILEGDLEDSDKIVLLSLLNAKHEETLSLLNIK